MKTADYNFIKKMADKIYNQISYVNGWYVSEKTLRGDCYQAAKKIIKSLKKPKRK